MNGGRGARGAALLALLLATTAADGPGVRIRVARRKALFIEQFTRLVEWPPAALPADRPFTVCLQGASDTADELVGIAEIRHFKERPTEVRRLRPGGDLAGCHVLYLAGSEAPRLAQTLEAAAERPVLTVSDTPGFAERGVQFNLFEETRLTPQPGTYVNFELNVAAVKRSPLMFDPRLLSSGRRVEAPPVKKP